LQKSIASFLKFIVLLSIAIRFLLLTFRWIYISETLHKISQANLFWLSLSIGASLVAFASRAYRWNLLIEPLDYNPKFKNTAYALMVGYLANLALPRLGEVTRCGSLSKAEKIPFNSLLGTVIVERVIDVISLLICMLLALVPWREQVGDFVHGATHDLAALPARVPRPPHPPSGAETLAALLDLTPFTMESQP